MKTLQISPEAYEAMKAATEEKTNPMLTLARHAGWRFVAISITGSEDDGFSIEWLAANSVTSRIVRFMTVNDVPEACFESAAHDLVELLSEEL